MGHVSIKRVGYEQTVFERLKHLAPIGEKIELISEDQHIERLRRTPGLSSSVKIDEIIDKIERMKQEDAQDLYTVLAPKPDSSRISIVFSDEDDVVAHTVWTLRKSMGPDYELYIGSAKFRFGIFITCDGIQVWDAKHER